MQVTRYSKANGTPTGTGDFLKVGDIDLGDFRDLADAEYERAGSASNMRPMFFTGSTYGPEILKLAQQVRGKGIGSSDGS